MNYNAGSNTCDVIYRIIYVIYNFICHLTKEKTIISYLFSVAKTFSNSDDDLQTFGRSFEKWRTF